MRDAEAKLKEVAEQLRKDLAHPEISVRELLNWFGVARRGVNINAHIRETLHRHDLTTNPDFEAE